MNEPNTEDPGIDPIPAVHSSPERESASESTHEYPESQLSRSKYDELRAFLGKPDAVIMRELLARAKDEQSDLETRVSALIELRVLVENTGNVKSLKHLQMYPELLSLLSHEVSDAIRRQALWILGTAVENNLDAQAELTRYDPLPQILSILVPSAGSRPSEHTRTIAASTLVAVLVRNEPGVRRLGYLDAWGFLNIALQDPDVVIRSTIAFLIDQLLRSNYMPAEFSAPQVIPRRTTQLTAYPQGVPPESPSLPESATALSTGLSSKTTAALTFIALQAHGVIRTLVESLTRPSPGTCPELGHIDEGYVEKAANALVTYLNVGGQLDETEKELLEPFFYKPSCRIVWGLDQAAWDTLKQAVYTK